MVQNRVLGHWPDSEGNQVFKRKWIRVLTEEQIQDTDPEHLLVTERGVITVGEYLQRKQQVKSATTDG